MTRYLLVFLLIVLSPALLVAGNTGKIAGKIVNEEGKRLPFVNVVLVGTSLGAHVSEDGTYFIINIPPGTYTAKASLVGYTAATTSKINVSVDRTTEVNFQLEPEAVNMNEVTVVARPPLVIKDKTSSAAKISAEEIKELPVQDVADVLKLQAGVVVGEDGGIHMRGGRATEISYMLNGISITDAFSGVAGMRVENNAVQEISVVSGTFNAEYGQAQSGIVNIVTKEGGEQYSGSVTAYLGSYLSPSHEYFMIQKFRPLSVQDYQGLINGPVPGLDMLRFFLSGRYLKDEGYLYGKRMFNVGDSSNFSSPLASEWQVSPTGDGAYVPMNNNTSTSFQGSLKAQVSSAISLLMVGSYSNRQYREYDHLFKYDPDGDYSRFNDGSLLSLTMTHLLSPSTFYEITGADFRSHNKYYTFENPVDPRYAPDTYLESKPYNFKSGGAKMDHLYRTTVNRTGKVEFNSQFDNTNLIKGGFDGKWYTLSYEWYNVINNERTGFKPSIDPAIQGPFSRQAYDVHPFQFGTYIQDKIELHSFIVNLGVRYDYFNSRYVVPVDFRDPTNSPKKPASPKTQISPRLGIAYPLSDRGSLHFSYGHFFQIPPFEYLYYNPDFAIVSGSLASIIGNADLEAERTVAYEVGLQQQLSDEIVLDASGFYKDIRNLLGTEIHRTNQQTLYARYINKDYGNVRGITIAISKRKLNTFVGASLDYTFSIAEGNSSDPNSVYLDNQSTPPIESEVQLVPLNWDQRHTLNATISLGQQQWGVDFIGRYGSGLPYTPTLQGIRTTTFPQNSEKKPPTVNVDLQAYYQLRIGENNVTLSLSAFNLLDQRNEVQVYSETGRAGYTVIPGRDDIPVVVSTMDDFLTRPDFYSPPRLIKFGVQVNFNQQ
jgi:outer membrane receptor protein involved in Fe transport